MIEVIDTEAVFLSCHISGDTLALAHDNAQLDGALEIYLDQRSHSTIALTDFEHNGERIRVHVFTIGPDGALAPWDRNAEGVTSLTITASNDPATLDFTVMAVAYEPAGQPTQDDIDAFVPTTWQAKVRVDVPPKGSKPV